MSGDAPTAGGIYVEATAGVAADLACGVCVSAVGDFAGFNVLWVGYVFHWIHVDALGSWIGDGVLCGRDCLVSVDAGTRNFFSRHDTSVSEEGSSRMETLVKVCLGSTARCYSTGCCHLQCTRGKRKRKKDKKTCLRLPRKRLLELLISVFRNY